MLQIPSPE